LSLWVFLSMGILLQAIEGYEKAPESPLLATLILVAVT